MLYLSPPLPPEAPIETRQGKFAGSFCVLGSLLSHSKRFSETQLLPRRGLPLGRCGRYKMARGLPRHLVFFALLAFPLWFPLASPGQTGQPGGAPIVRTFSIRGTVRDSDDGHAYEMIKVELRRMTGELLGTTFTRSNGEFEFNGATNGLYLILVEEKGFEPVRENIEIANVSRVGVFIFLKRPLEIAASEPGRTVSARELALPRKARDAMQRGLERLYAKQPDLQGSLGQFRRAVAELPSYYEAYHHMGVAYMLLGQATEAEQALRKSVALSEGRYAEAQFALAALLSDEKRFTEAEPVARRGLEIAGNSWQGHYQLARALLGLNRLDAAEKSILEARARKADFPSLHLLLANIHIRTRNYQALLQDLDSYLKLEPNGPMSEQARDTREKIQRALAAAKNTPPAPPPKP